MTEPLLSARGVYRQLGADADRFEVLIEHLVLAAGDRLAITGASGSGKSTILALLALALKPHAAEAFDVTGNDVRALWQRRRLDDLSNLRGRLLGFVPQTGGLLPFLTLRANIALPLALLGRPDPARVNELAALLDIAAALDRKPEDVSVGQRQRAAVARAVVHAPALLLADEPTAAVHPTQAKATMRLLVAAAAEARAALLIATHDAALAEATDLTTVPLRMAAGRAESRFAWPC